jgi:glycosyltransferase involved in cell wall biosynthesis
LDAEQYLKELRRANVFVLPSFLENSSNSLCEAMLVGTSCVASFVGGVSSLVSDEMTALCFPPGDEAVLAEQLRRFFSDEAQAKRFSKNAMDIARKRHDRQTVANRMVEIYRKVLENKCEE